MFRSLHKVFTAASALVFLTACTGGSMAGDSGAQVRILPDYQGVTVPRQIAPANFRIMEEGSCFRTVFSADGCRPLTVRGRKAVIPVRRWHKMLATADSIAVQVSAKTAEGRKYFDTFYIYTCDDPIDRYVSYRLIPPSFQKYEEISLCQRDLYGYKEKPFYSNTLVQRTARGEGQCVNCHHFQAWDASQMQFHARAYKGGTVHVRNRRVSKSDLKNGNMISAGVYPAWHPQLDLIAYSTNTTVQEFKTAGTDRIEVFDAESDLVLYDLETGRVSGISCDPEQLECFPAWAPDGHRLYYVSARPDIPEGMDPVTWIGKYPDSVRYSIMARDFYPESHSWSDADTVFDAPSLGMSATLPRISPDGRWLMFTMAPAGVFHVWHHEADLYMMDLQDGSVRRLDETDSQYADSYHSWTSGGKWMVMGTRRDDAGYTRLYFSHLDTDGTFTKPFALPQRNPEADALRLYSYNVPEFTVNKVKVRQQKLALKVRRMENAKTK